MTTIIKFNKQTLCTLFLNKLNLKEQEVAEAMTLSSRQASWFDKNINYTAREVELIMSTISRTSVIYSPTDISYTIGYPITNDIEQLAELLERFFIEKQAHFFHSQFTLEGANKPDNTTVLYSQIKSLTLNISKNDYDKFR